MVQNEWNIYYCIYNMKHFIYIMKTMSVFNTLLLCYVRYPLWKSYFEHYGSSSVQGTWMYPL